MKHVDPRELERRAERERIRAEIEGHLERLIAMLDSLDGDPDIEADSDFEPQGDEEPALGAPERHPGYPGLLGGPDVSQLHWGSGGDRDELEITCEDEGADITDQPHDGDADAEHSLGWGANLDQRRLSRGTDLERDQHDAKMIARFNARDVDEAAETARRDLRALQRRRRGNSGQGNSLVDCRPWSPPGFA